MEKLLYLRNLDSSWVLQDKETLSTKFEIIDGNIRSLKDLFRAVINVPSSQVVFAWFGSFIFYPVILVAWIMRKRIYIIGGGYDIAFVPQLGYGAFYGHPLKKLLRRSLFMMANKVLGISNCSFFEAYFNARLPISKIEIVDLGFNLPVPARVLPWSERKNRVITISPIDENGILRKGVFRLLQLAAMSPEIEFLIVGKVSPDVRGFLEKNFPANIKILGFVDNAGMFELMMNSKIAIQLSMHESFGASLIEAAMYGCFPIVSSEYSLPEVADGPGMRVSYTHYEDVRERIHKVLDSVQDSQHISDYYRNKYPLSKRQEKLLNIVL